MTKCSECEKMREALTWAKSATLAMLVVERTVGSGKNSQKLEDGYEMIIEALQSCGKDNSQQGEG